MAGQFPFTSLIRLTVFPLLKKKRPSHIGSGPTAGIYEIRSKRYGVPAWATS